MPAWIAALIQLAQMVPTVINIVVSIINIIKGSTTPTQTARDLHEHVKNFTCDGVGCPPTLKD